jgi:hypothetical protein
VETTLRSRAAIDQAAQAKSSGFDTALLFVATEDVEENISRVARRGRLGGHSAPAAEIREIFEERRLLHAARDMNYTPCSCAARGQPGRVSACEQERWCSAPWAAELRWQPYAAATLRKRRIDL